MEFLTTISLVLVIAIVMGFLFHNKVILTSNFRKEIVARDIVKELAENINSICVVGHGHSHYVTLPTNPLGDGRYEISLHSDEASVFIDMEDINKFAPTFTQRMECTMGDCWTNQTAGKTYLGVGKPTRVRIANLLDSICLQDDLSYNLGQAGNTWRVIPFRGDRMTEFPGVVENSTDLLMYLYLNEDTGTTTLLFKLHEPGASPGSIINLDFGYDGHKRPTGLFAVADGTAQFDPDMDWAKWQYTTGLVGGGIEFNPACIYLEVTPRTIPAGHDWVWVNPNGERIQLNTNNPVTIIYP
ncbi:MAG: hypothetical protein B6U72_05500 [Candidatus Altiarchaeales archaeon ex4484_2]|nr:MAG: hypothetical protein B6U72_05500 [Candidatus Altiarchaeales archaeon ex4484_2]